MNRHRFDTFNEFDSKTTCKIHYITLHNTHITLYYTGTLLLLSLINTNVMVRFLHDFNIYCKLCFRINREL